MRRIKPFICCVFLLAIMQGFSQAREYYQLKIYSFDTEAQQKTTDAYLKDAFLPA
ncbi:hypothetical protein [Maribacter sp. 2307UL18-2]|uniref:hypothetical protein n=1 Tax=Maribacter sp. 2307UL18-2 TaxID=3386274 RepID=UPI0039BC9671